jgi:hypothetical protein
LSNTAENANTARLEPGTRREVLKVLIAALAGSAVNAGLAFEDANAAVPNTEGMFFFAEKSDRVFFISSAWLAYFEVTDFYSETDLQKVIKWRNSNFNGKEKWRVLYTEELNDFNSNVVTAWKDPPEQLNAPSKTYIAMSLSPSITAP